MCISVDEFYNRIKTIRGFQYAQVDNICGQIVTCLPKWAISGKDVEQIFDFSSVLKHFEIHSLKDEEIILILWK